MLQRAASPGCEVPDEGGTLPLKDGIRTRAGVPTPPTLATVVGRATDRVGSVSPGAPARTSRKNKIRWRTPCSSESPRASPFLSCSPRHWSPIAISGRSRESAAAERRGSKSAVRSPSPGRSTPNGESGEAAVADRGRGRAAIFPMSPGRCAHASESGESAAAEESRSKAVVSARLVTRDSVNMVSPADADQTIYMDVLKQLLGEEVRRFMREELASALASSAPRPEVGLEEEAAAEPGYIQDHIDIAKHESYLEDGIKEIATSSELKRDHRGRARSDRWSSLIPLFRRFEALRYSFGTMIAPGEDYRSRQFVESRWWNAAVNIVVVVNCAVMAFSADQQVQDAEFSESTDNIFFRIDIALLTFYSFEFILKLMAYGRFFFYDVNWRSNYLDSILLFTSLWSVAFTLLASSQGIYQNYTWLRLFRLLRLLRTLRVIRLASNFSPLRGILASLIDSFWMLIWSIATLALMIFMFSLVFVSRLAGHIHSNPSRWESGDYQTVLEYFGSVSLAMKSLFMASTGGSEWGHIYLALEPVNYSDAALFLFFIVFIQLALMNIILGVFVEHAMKSMQPDNEQKAHELALEAARLEEELRTLCCRTDTDQSGRITSFEWEAALQDGKVNELLDLLGFPRRHATKFFSMMAHRGESGESYVHVDEFVQGCIKLRGFASSFDMNAVLLEVRDTRDLVMSEVKLLHNLMPVHHRRGNRSDNAAG